MLKESRSERNGHSAALAQLKVSLILAPRLTPKYPNLIKYPKGIPMYLHKQPPLRHTPAPRRFLSVKFTVHLLARYNQ